MPTESHRASQRTRLTALASSPVSAYGPIRRMLILKLDHIGDMLLAAPALALLRNSFAEAHITLICAPWNAGIVKRLRFADEVHCVNLYTAGPREGVRQVAIDALEALELSGFDLAIDLRRDSDTRELLKLFRARHVAGFGDSQVFGFLDVALPTPIDTTRHGATRVCLGPLDLDGGAGHRITERGLYLTAQVGELPLELSTDALWPPSDDGIADTRLLGAALWRVEIRVSSGDGPDRGRFEPVEILSDHMRFDGNWLEPEPWGRWSSAQTALVTLRFPMRGGDIELLARVQGHTSPSHPVATVTARVPGAQAQHLFRTGDGPVTLSLGASAKPAPVVAKSEPFLLHAGRYQVRLRLHLDEHAAWSPLVVRLRGARMNRIVARYTTPDSAPPARDGERPGDSVLVFDFEHADSAEPLAVEISPVDSRRACDVAIASIEAICTDLLAPKLPLSHIEIKLLDLAAMVANRFAARLTPAAPGSIAACLGHAGAGSTAEAAVERLRRLRDRRGPVWARLRAPRGRTLIGVGLGANKQTKLWPEEHFYALCRLMLRRPDVDLVFVGGPAEAEPVQRMVARLRGGDRVIDLCQCCKIEDLGEVLAMLDGFVGLDTGTTHFAGRVGIRTVAIFGHAHDPREWGPVGDRTAWVAADIACRGCSLSDFSQCPIGVACMADLQPAEVWPVVEQHLFGDVALGGEAP